ncbi:uncharacterized protein LOC115449876 isoform X2 [Manduca sexta]|uniref:uncharacterized protein LOC115449876 isoform X2 n=1 Tax=Manduca sexta TaxID=7130 RepID=UPI001182C005|nr:uncharacterized protein LOC115449876 isoform X2 [Manduca sexta]
MTECEEYQLKLDLVSSFLNISRHNDAINGIKVKDTRRKRKKSESTSSSGGDHDSSGDSAESLGLSISKSTGSSEEKKKKFTPKESIERRGWRRWHRKCTPCPDDMWKKWRDPSIKWICGAYQRARRSFKSLCMMHYRNCQDGTMFVKIHDHRCKNDSTSTKRFGTHFFYEYKVVLSHESTDTASSTSEEHVHTSDY